MKEALETVRIDRWLMAARFYKTRSQAAKACEGRKVKINGLVAKPHKTIRIGDRITVHHTGRYRNIEVLGLAQRGLPPAVARELYHEEQTYTPSDEEIDLRKMMRVAEKKVQPKYKGRPTKRERRKLDQAKEDLLG